MLIYCTFINTYLFHIYILQNYWTNLQRLFAKGSALSAEGLWLLTNVILLILTTEYLRESDLQINCINVLFNFH